MNARMSMTAAFLYVTLRSFYNRMLQNVKRLRNPRYLMSTLAGLAYLYFLLFRRMHNGQMKMMPAFGELGRDIASLVILCILIFAWALPQDSGGITLTETEIQFLFPAPLTRRQILLYKVFRSLPPLAISAAFATFFGARQGKYIGTFCAIVAMTLYLMMVGQARAWLRRIGIGWIKRQIIVVAIFIGLSVWFSMTLDFSGLHLREKSNGKALAESAVRAATAPFHTPAMNALLALPRVIAFSTFPGTWYALALNALLCLAFAALCFVIAAALDNPFEEASIIVSQSKAQQTERRLGRAFGRRISYGRIPPPFRLKELGAPEVAMFWKNLVATLRISAGMIGFLATLVIALIGAGLFVTNQALIATFAGVALMLCALLPIVMSNVFAQDLRLDLSRLDLLKTMPIAGERLLAASMAAPIAVIAFFEVVTLVSASLVLQRLREAGVFRYMRTPEFITVALLFAVPICALQYVIRNGVAVYFPALVCVVREEPRGFVAIGQRLVSLLGNLVVLAIALVPAALLLVPAILLARHFFADSEALLAFAIMPSVALLIGEVVLGVKVIGNQFEQMDVSEAAMASA